MGIINNLEIEATILSNIGIIYTAIKHSLNSGRSMNVYVFNTSPQLQLTFKRQIWVIQFHFKQIISIHFILSKTFQ